MPRLIRRILSLRGLFQKSKDRKAAGKKWTADFSKQSLFESKAENSYDANLQKTTSGNVLFLGLKKKGCIAWTNINDTECSDLLINARIRIAAGGAYAAAGIMFRMIDEDTCYSFLISNKAYFRLDIIRNGAPLPLIAWTELPNRAAAEITASNSVDFTIIALGSLITILIRDEWAAEIYDSTLPQGSIAFSGACYENNSDTAESAEDGIAPAVFLSSMPENSSSYTAGLFLEALTVDSRMEEISALHEKKTDSAGIDPHSRIRLAETFTAMNQNDAALVQIKKALKDPLYKKEQRTLLLAGRIASAMGLYEEAESYISSCFGENVESAEGKEALVEMTKILYATERYQELKSFCKEALKAKPDDPIIKTFQGHAYWNLNEYKAAAAAYDAASRVNKGNGLLSKNAANVYDVMGEKQKALERYLSAGSAFLEEENYNDLGLIVPKLIYLGKDSYKAHALIGKWAFAIEDWQTASDEFKKAEDFRRKNKNQPREAAVAYLEALLLIQKGRREEALPLLEEAVSLQKKYALFRFKLAECKYILHNDPHDPELRSDIKKALSLSPDDAWINNFAAEVFLAGGNDYLAGVHLEKAAALLGDVPSVRRNQAELLSRQGKLNEALALLETDAAGDPDGSLSNCAGNLLVREGRYSDASAYYRQAVKNDPANNTYLLNLAQCLIKTEFFGEADSILVSIPPNPDVLELISYVASKKGEFKRAEAACLESLKIEPEHKPTLFSLCWIYASMVKRSEGEEILRRLTKMDLDKAELSRYGELRNHYLNLYYQDFSCSSCGRSWKVLKDPPSVKSLRLVGEPPDGLPAGSCPTCGKTFCIGCAKKFLDDKGRFICADCDKPLKLSNDGLRKIVSDWAAQNDSK